MRQPYLRFALASVLLFGLARPGKAAQFHVSHIGVTPPAPTSIDPVQLKIYGYLANSGSFIANSAAAVNGFDVALTVNADNSGGITIPITIPDTVTFELGTLAPGTYTITIAGTQVEDAAPLEQHTFTVLGGPTVCDSLVIASVNWAPFSDTAIMVHVFNPTSTLFDYPGFLLLDANGDTLAQETVNFFGIPAENWHTLTVRPNAVIPDGTFTGTLELWTGFYQALACSWEMDFNLCPSAACSTVFPMIQNYGSGTATGSFLYHIQQGGTQVASGTLTLSSDVQYESDTLCLAPGQYLMQIIPQQGPNGGQPHFGVAAGGLIQGPTAAVIWTTNSAVPFTFYGPCADDITGIDDIPSVSLILARSTNGIGLARSDNKALGELQVFDALGRTVTRAKVTLGRWPISTTSWRAGLYLIRSIGADKQVLVTRFVVE